MATSAATPLNKPSSILDLSAKYLCRNLAMTLGSCKRTKVGAGPQKMEINLSLTEQSNTK